MPNRISSLGRRSKPDLVIAYGDQPHQMVPALLDQLGVAAHIPKDKTIGIKPNLVVAKPSQSGATTNPEIVASLVDYLHKHGVSKIEILESAWVGDSTQEAYRVCGYHKLAEQYQVPLVDLKHEASVAVQAQSMDIEVCRRVLELDYLINVPVLKAHCQTKLTCSLKNLKGCIPDSEKRRFHQQDLQRSIAQLNSVIRTDLVVVDGIIGDLTFEEGDTPVKMDRMLAGYDPVLIDAYAASLLGYEPCDIEYIRLAQALGIGSADINKASLVEINQGSHASLAGNRPSNSMAEYATYFTQDRACSACVGSLLHALQRLCDRGQLSSLPDKISIGQGFQTCQGNGLGVGDCTGDCIGVCLAVHPTHTKWSFFCALC